MAGSTIILTCPDCQRIVSFSSDHTNLIICSSCGSVIYRDEHGQLLKRPQFIISTKESLIQPGTTGSYKKKSFTVLGRFRAWYEESVFNYWTLQYADGEIGILGEGYGLYGMLTKHPLNAQVSAQMLKELEQANVKMIPGVEKFIVDKKLQTVKWDIEGELFIPLIESAFYEFDLSAQSGKNFIIFLFKKSEIFAYLNEPVEFEDLQLKDLRKPGDDSTEITCVNCQKQIKIKAFPYSQSYGCVHCGTFLYLRNGMDLVKEKRSKRESDFPLSIGTKGIIREKEYEVIGCSEKEEQNVYHAKWREYTLYNAADGFAFLSEYDGNWTFIKERVDAPVLFNQNEKSFELNGEPYLLYNSYSSVVLSAKGEFPYNIFDNEQTKVREFISPPEVWIQERDKREGVTWYFGTHVDSKLVKRNFQVEKMPRKIGVGAVQPTGYMSLGKLFRSTLAAVILLIFIHMVVGFNKEERVVFDQTIPFFDSTNKVSQVTPKFELDKWRSNLQFKIHASVNNSWFELAATLVNADNGKEYSLEQGVEYYYGYSEGESWTEGSQSEDAYLTRIPAGTYFLQLEGTREAGQMPIPSFYLRVVYDVSNSRNLIWSVALLLLWPIAVFFRNNYYEKSRWSNSPYSTFNT